MQELDLIADADARARTYLAGVEDRRPFPDQAARDGLAVFAESFSERGHDAAETMRLLDRHGSPATTASNGPRYFGFVIGAALPVAAAAERLMLWLETGAACTAKGLVPTLRVCSKRPSLPDDLV